MLKMPTIIGHASSIVNTIKIDAIELVFIPFDKAANPVLSDRLLGELPN